MSTQYHISPKDKIARRCDAPIRGCNFGIPESGHLSADEAVEHNARIAQGDNPTVQSLKKPKKRKLEIWEDEPHKQSKAEQDAIKAERKGTNKSNSTEEQNKQRKAFYNSDPGSMTRFHVILTKDIPQDVQDEIIKSMSSIDISTLAGNPYISEKTMMTIPIYNMEVADGLSSNQNASKDVLIRLIPKAAQFKEPITFENIVNHPNADAEVIDEVAKVSRMQHIKGMIARNSKSSEKTLLRLSKTKSESLQAAIAMNKNSSTKVLDNLMKNGASRIVQEYIAKNPNATEKMKSLIEDF